MKKTEAKAAKKKVWPEMKRLPVNKNYCSDIWESEIVNANDGEDWIATIYGTSARQCLSRANAIVDLGKKGVKR